MVLKLWSGHDYHIKLQRGGVMIFNLCILSDDAVYLAKFRENISTAFRVIEQTRFAY